MIVFFLLIWLAGIAAAMSRRWIRTRRDAWPIVCLWPIVLAYIVAILIFEGFYKLFVALRHDARRRRWTRR